MVHLINNSLCILFAFLLWETTFYCSILTVSHLSSLSLQRFLYQMACVLYFCFDTTCASLCCCNALCTNGTNCKNEVTKNFFVPPPPPIYFFRCDFPPCTWITECTQCVCVCDGVFVCICLWLCVSMYLHVYIHFDAWCKCIIYFRLMCQKNDYLQQDAAQ